MADDGFFKGMVPFQLLIKAKELLSQCRQLCPMQELKCEEQCLQDEKCSAQKAQQPAVQSYLKLIAASAPRVDVKQPVVGSRGGTGSMADDGFFKGMVPFQLLIKAKELLSQCRQLCPMQELKCEEQCLQDEKCSAQKAQQPAVQSYLKLIAASAPRVVGGVLMDSSTVVPQHSTTHCKIHRTDDHPNTHQSVSCP
ncbi:hypothetical protein CYMTET_20176 [Cymbomonas tetramitiformis]|uniref:Uncharacterized protein n=1 Tax=Cymbomonas tetramitiformis TaxID=36881 RepID=A0AAE0G4M5_9CHLO|nr:hypothetical protein CYMTET_20176 [Cymbomonas tetramitiformis]